MACPNTNAFRDTHSPYYAMCAVAVSSCRWDARRAGLLADGMLEEAPTSFHRTSCRLNPRRRQ
eukprot:4356602-Pyramimonas_sp.AAC.1